MKTTQSCFTIPKWMQVLVRDMKADAGLLKQVSERLDQRSKVMDTEPAAFLDTLFLKAIVDRFGSSRQSGHLYLQQYEIPQIVLFDILINQFPFVHLAHTMVNDTLASVAGDAAHLVLLDVGIGRGIQTVRLMDCLRRNSRLQRLTIVGVEPYKEALGHAQQAIKAAAANQPFQVAFEGINCLVEELDTAILQASIPARYDTMIVNASLTLHHTPTPAQRHAFFRMLRAFQPAALLLTEPDSDHLQPDWPQRVRNAYIHYSAVFSVIDSLDIDTRARNGLKLFFGREIEDVVAHAEDQRYERHEPTEQWIAYCKENGFTIRDHFIMDGITPPPFIQIKHTPAGYLAMEHKGLNILSLIHATT